MTPPPTPPTTPLDLAQAAMEAAPDRVDLRLAWFDRLAASEMFLLLEAEAEAGAAAAGGTVRPLVFPVEGADLVAAFDREERLADFAGGAAPFVAVSGRTLAQMLAGAGLGLAVNPGTGAETVLEVEAVRWLEATLAARPDVVQDRPDAILPPGGLPETLLAALDARLAAAEGRATRAHLVATRHDDGRRGHLLAFVGAVPGSEAALAQLVAEALAFSGLEAASLDVGFFAAGDPVCARLARVGLAFDLPEPLAPGTRDVARPAPGSDPERPPRLR